MNITIKSLLPFAAVILASCQGTLGDPKTLTKGDLNPPFRLVSVTNGESMMLQWTISNTEEDLKGFNVYLIDKSLAEVQSKLAQGRFKGYQLGSQQIPRCDDTKSVFEMFGFNPASKFSTKKCDNLVADASLLSGESGLSELSLAADDSDKPTFVKCFTRDLKNDIGTDGQISVDITKAVDPEDKPIPTAIAERVGKTLRCSVPKDALLSNGVKGIKIGTKYTAFVIAVQGDKGNKISFTSNFIEDIPTPYSVRTTTLDAGKYRVINMLRKNGAVTGDFSEFSNARDCEGFNAEATEGCQLYRKIRFEDRSAATDPLLSFAEDVQPGSERVFVAGESDRVFLVSRTAPAELYGKPGVFAPGDKPLAYDPTQYHDGENLIAFPGALFDIALREQGRTYYGKIYFDSMTSNTAGAETLGNGSKTIKVYLALQPAADEPFYALARPGRWLGQH